MNIAARLEERARRHADRPAIVEGRGRRRREIRFGELADDAARVSARLRRRGVGPGDRVLLFVPMSVDLYTALLGVLHAGAVAVFVDAWADRRRLEDAVAAAGPVAFVGTPKAHLLRLLSRSLRRVPIRLWAGPGPLRLARSRRAAGRGGRTGSDRTGSGAAASPDGSPADLAADAPALVTFTTGTTGRPKAAARSHGFLWAQHRALAGHLGLREQDVDMPTLPVFVLNNLALGVPSVIPAFDPRRPGDIDPAAILGQMRAEGVTTTSGSPAFYARLVDHVEERGETIPVRALFTGGAPVFPPLAERLAAVTEGDVHVVYGSTEAEPIAGITAAELVEAAREPSALGVCAGTLVPEIEGRIIRPVDGPVVLEGGWGAVEVETGETGELVVAGPHVLEGYLNDPESESRNKIRDGERVWHRTGDGVREDGDRLWLMGRLSQRVERSDGTWWSMAAEARALRVEGVGHAAYLGVGGRALLCVEMESLDAGTGGAAGSSGPGPGVASALRAALGGIPVDEIRVLRIPRDPRHASKTDVGALRALLDQGSAPTHQS